MIDTVIQTLQQMSLSFLSVSHRNLIQFHSAAVALVYFSRVATASAVQNTVKGVLPYRGRVLMGSGSLPVSSAHCAAGSPETSVRVSLPDTVR